MTKIITGRRRLLRTAGLGAAALAAPSIWRKARAQGGTVNVWTYANFLPDDFVEQFQDETGIEVRVRLVDDQGKQFNLMAAEAAEPERRHRYHRRAPLPPVHRLRPCRPPRHRPPRQLEDGQAGLPRRRVDRRQRRAVGRADPLRRRGAGLEHRNRARGANRQLGGDVQSRVRGPDRLHHPGHDVGRDALPRL